MTQPVARLDVAARKGSISRTALCRLGLELPRNHHIAWQYDGGAFAQRRARYLACRFQMVALAKRFSNLESLRGEKRVRHAAADDQHVHALHEIGDDATNFPSEVANANAYTHAFGQGRPEH